MISSLFVVLIVLVIGALPAWPYSRTWGFYPSSVIGLIIIWFNRHDMLVRRFTKGNNRSRSVTCRTVLR